MISIVIPTLQEGKILERMLVALKAAKREGDEIIVSDGLSTDNTVEIARKYADQVIVHDGKTRQTIAEGRNAGARAAKGEYVVFLDSDVFVQNSETFWDRAISHFESDPKLLALTCRLKTLPDYENWGDYISWGIITHFQQFVNNVLRIGVSSGEFQMFRKDVFLKAGGYNPSIVFGEDAEIFYRLSKIGRTKLDGQMCVMHTSRRAHNMGWISLWSLWTVNVVSSFLRKKAVSTEWKVSR